MKKYSLIAAVAAVSSLAAFSNATTLFDQIGPDATSITTSGYASQNFEAAFSQYSIVALDDFTTTASYTLTNAKFAMFFYNTPATANFMAGVTGFHVEIFNYNGGTPVTSNTGDVADLAVAPASASNTGNTYGGDSNAYLVTLDLTSNNFSLAAGHYWMGVTLDNSFTNNGQTAILGSTLVDAGSVAANARQINSGGGFALAGNNAAISPGANLEYQLNGAVATPEPASMAVLGVGALALIRRRRSKKA